MAFGHSFTKLLNDKFLDKLCEVSSAYIEEHGDGLDLKLHNLNFAFIDNTLFSQV